MGPTRVRGSFERVAGCMVSVTLVQGRRSAFRDKKMNIDVIYGPQFLKFIVFYFTFQY